MEGITKGLAVLKMEKVTVGLSILMSDGLIKEIVIWGMIIRRSHRMLHSNHFFHIQRRVWP